MTEKFQNTATRKNSPYAQVPNSVLNDSRLSLKAKGLMAYFYSKPVTWKFWLTHLLEQSSDGEVSLKSAIKELKTYGYLTIDIVQNEKGQIVGRQWNFHDDGDGHSGEIKKQSTISEVSHLMDNPPGGKARTSNTKYSKTEDSKEPPNPLKGEPPDGGGGGVPFYTSKDKSVKMLQAEYDALVKENGQEITDACIQRLSEWKEENPGKKRKNDYRCILRWVLLAVKEKQAREKKLAAAETPKPFPMQPPSKQTPPPPSASAEDNRQEFMHFRKANWERSKETKIYLEDRVSYCQIGKLKVSYEDKNFFNLVITTWNSQLEGKNESS